VNPPSSQTATPDLVIVVAMAAAVIVLVRLWRLGPRHRRAFFLVGLGIGVGFMVLGLFQDDVEGYLGRVGSDVIESLEEAAATPPPDAVASPRPGPAALVAGGVSVALPSG
jgi:hypothetical protein